MAVLGYLPKLKRGLWCTFSAGFFHKNVPYLILYQETKFQCHIFFSFSRYQAKGVSKFLFGQLMTS